MLNLGKPKDRQKSLIEERGILFMAKRQWIAKYAAGFVILLIIGGIAVYQNRFEPAAFTQAVLDASYKNITDGYMKQTGADQETADAVFEKNIETAMAQFTTAKLSDELTVEYRNLFAQIVKQVNYKVGEAVKEKDGSYAVVVTVRPILLFTDIYEIFRAKAQEYAETVSNRVMAGERMPTEQEMEMQLYQLYYEILKEKTQFICFL